MKPEQRHVPNTNEICMFFHCSQCMPLKPVNKSPREWVQIEAGFTPVGIQVWCRRCEANIVHVDFQGMQHPANTTRKRKL